MAGVAAAELPLLLLISPALLFPSRARVCLALLVPLTWLCHRRLGGRWIPATPLNTSLVVLLVMVGVSVVATFDIAFSLGKISGVVLGVLLFWAITRWMTTPHTLKIGTIVYVMAGAGLAVIGLFGTNWIGKFSVLGAVIQRLPRVIRGVPAQRRASSQTRSPDALCCSFPSRPGCWSQARGSTNSDGAKDRARSRGRSRARWRC